MKTAILGGILAAATIGLSGCDKPAPAESAGADQAAAMTITNPRMVLAPVAGNPAAVYFDLTYTGDKNVALSRVSVKGAKSAMFHDYGDYDGKRQMMDMLPVPLTKGDKLEFKPGAKHVMAMDPSPDLKPGGTAEVTLTVSGGTSQTFAAPIRAAGDER